MGENYKSRDLDYGYEIAKDIRLAGKEIVMVKIKS